MADQSVDILITIKQQGQETLKSIDNDLAKLGKTQDTGTKTTTLQSTAMDKLNTSLIKQYPNLKSLIPLMGGLGLSTLLTTGIFTGLSVLTMQMGQNFQTLMTDIALLGVVAGTSGVNLGGFAGAAEEAQKMADSLGITLADATSGLTKLLPVTRDAGAAETLLTDAVKAHKDTGVSLNKAIDDYIGSLTGAKPVIDDVTGKILLGGDAVNYLNKQYEKVGTSGQKFNTMMDDSAKKAGSDWMIGFGMIGRGLLDVLEGIFVAFTWTFGTAIPWAIAQPINYILSIIDWFKTAWFGVLDYYNKGWFGLWEGIKTVSRNAAQWVADHTINPLINLLNQVLNLWNMIPGLPHAQVPDVTIPKFAQGGIVTQPTIGLLGEAGPEAVIPLSKGMGGPTTIQLVLSDGTKLAEWVWNQLDTQARLKGAF